VKTSNPMNSVVHFEIPATKPERAKEFYKKVFGWSIFDFDEETALVTTTESEETGLPKTPGAINGSLYRSDGSKTVTAVINVEDINAHIRTVESNGGKLVDAPVTVPGMGMYARFKDTEGNLMGLWQNL